MAQDGPLVFIDTNVLLDLYDIPVGPAVEALDRLEAHKDDLVTSEQGRREFLRNRDRVLLRDLRDLQVPGEARLPCILGDLEAAQALSDARRHYADALDDLVHAVRNLLVDPVSGDRVAEAAVKLFDPPGAWHLAPDDGPHADVYETVYDTALRRHRRGDPPRKRQSTSIGDAIHWTWCLEAAKRSGRDLVVATRDRDFGTTQAGRSLPDPLLVDDFRHHGPEGRSLRLTTHLDEVFGALGIEPPDGIAADDQDAGPDGDVA